MDQAKLNKKMNKEKLPVWIRVGNLIQGFFDFLELLYAIPLFLVTILLSIMIAPFNLFLNLLDISLVVKDE
jgi:hypothetical protein